MIQPWTCQRLTGDIRPSVSGHRHPAASLREVEENEFPFEAVINDAGVEPFVLPDEFLARLGSAAEAPLKCASDHLQMTTLTEKSQRRTFQVSTLFV
jgi:hypothetical protein